MSFEKIESLGCRGRLLDLHQLEIRIVNILKKPARYQMYHVESIEKWVLRILWRPRLPSQPASIAPTGDSIGRNSQNIACYEICYAKRPRRWGLRSLYLGGGDTLLCLLLCLLLLCFGIFDLCWRLELNSHVCRYLFVRVCNTCICTHLCVCVCVCVKMLAAESAAVAL